MAGEEGVEPSASSSKARRFTAQLLPIIGSIGETRTRNHCINSAKLYQLSYNRITVFLLADLTRFELATFFVTGRNANRYTTGPYIGLRRKTRTPDLTVPGRA